MSARSSLMALLLLAAAAAASADPGPHPVALAREVFVDASRPTPASPPFPGSPERRLDTWIWYPAAAGERAPGADPVLAAGGPWPLIVYSHGTSGRPDGASHVCESLARAGYVVAAPAFPLTSSASQIPLPAADISDAGSQPGDVSFVIDSLLAHPRFGPAIDPERIGATGISLGGITTYFASFGHPTRDPRIRASAPIAAGDPPYAALGFGLGFAGTVPAPVSVPALLLAGDADLFTASTGGHAASYARLLPPRYEVEIHGAPHVWFGDRSDVPPDGLNPDCLWFEEHTGQRPPLCAERRPLIAPATQKAIVRHALRAFFDAYLKSDAGALARLQQIEARFEEVTLHSDPRQPERATPASGGLAVGAVGAADAGRLTGPIAGGRHGFPFASTVVDLAAAGFVEQEFFLAGTARGYTSDVPLGSDGLWSVAPVGRADYRTRILVRRPTEPARFNGTLVVEWLNVSGGADAAPDWAFLHPLLLAEGYAWAGVSAQAVGVRGFPPEHPRSALGTDGALVNWDPERYAPLVHPGDSYSYDIFTQAGRALLRRGDPQPLGDLRLERLIAIGESQAAARLVTYVNAVHPRARLYDAFLVHSRGGRGAPLSEAPEAEIPAPSPTRSRADLRVPALIFETETDLTVLDYYAARQPDAEWLRLWEVAGTAHADTYQLRVAGADGQKSVARESSALACDLPGNSGPQRYVLRAALHHLDRWLRDGTAPPRAPRLRVVPGAPSRILRDGYGNALGGIRTPVVDVPVATLSGEGNSGGMFCRLFGVTRPFDAETLARLYPSPEAYRAAFDQAVDDARQAGFLLEADAEEMRAAAPLVP